MSSYNGRRGVNVSQYIANLNTVPQPEDALESPTNPEDDQLSLFTREFMDWDGNGFGQSSTPFELNFDQPATTTAGADVSAGLSEPKLDFDLNGKLSYPSTVSLFLQPYFPRHRSVTFLCSVTYSLIHPLSPFRPFIIPKTSYRRISSNQRPSWAPAHPAKASASHHYTPRSWAIQLLAQPLGDGRLTRPRGAPCSSGLLPLRCAGTAHSDSKARNSPSSFANLTPHLQPPSCIFHPTPDSTSHSISIITCHD